MDLCSFEVGNRKPIFLIAGPCVIEGENLALETAATLKGRYEESGNSFHFQEFFR